MHPLQRSSQDSAHYNPTTLIHWVCTPSVPLFSGHNALRHTTSLLFSDPPPVPLSLSCTSPSWSVWPLTGLSLFYVWVSNPGRHSSVGNTLTTKRLCSVVVGVSMIRTVYIVAVWLIGARAFSVTAQKVFFRDQKFFF